MGITIKRPSGRDEWKRQLEAIFMGIPTLLIGRDVLTETEMVYLATRYRQNTIRHLKITKTNLEVEVAKEVDWHDKAVLVETFARFMGPRRDPVIMSSELKLEF